MIAAACYDESMSELFLEAQAWWDSRQFDPATGYEQLSLRDQKANHIYAHIGHAAFKFLKDDFKIRLTEVAPDLAIYRSQLINLFDIEAESVTAHYRPMGSLDTILREIVKGGGILAKYIERLHHGDTETWPVGKITDAARHLHVAARSTVEFYYPSEDSAAKLAEMQLGRMEQLLGEPLPQPLIKATATAARNTDN